MKIVIASDIYYPMTNGVAVFAHNLANGLAKAGHEVLVLSPSFNGKFHIETDAESGVRTAFLTSLRFPFYPDQINKVLWYLVVSKSGKRNQENIERFSTRRDSSTDGRNDCARCDVVCKEIQSATSFNGACLSR